MKENDNIEQQSCYNNESNCNPCGPGSCRPRPICPTGPTGPMGPRGTNGANGTKRTDGTKRS